VAEDPAHLVREHRLFDGRTVTLRPIRSEDAALVRDFLNQLSDGGGWASGWIWRAWRQLRSTTASWAAA